MASKNPNVKRGHTQVELTPEQDLEFAKCANDPIYFIENYIYVRHPVRGQTIFKLYDYQKKLILAYHEHKEVITLFPRQSGKSETSCAYLFWFAIFNEDKTILITSNKHKNAREMVSRIKYMYEHLPDFLKPGVTDDGWNALSLIFETGSRIISDATSETTGRGGSFSILYGDETAFVRPTIQSEFWASVSPTLATGGKMFLTSTPNGDSDLFATLWRGAERGVNGFFPISIKWNEVPGRDASFKTKEIAKNGILKWQQEYECIFVSSDPLLIDSMKAQTLKARRPKAVNHGIRIWEPFSADTLKADTLDNPVPKVQQRTSFDNWYQSQESEYYASSSTAVMEKQCIMTVDPSKGIGGDFTVIEVFSYPGLEQMMEYRANTSKTGEIYRVLKYLWKKAWHAKWNVMFTVENNGVGEGILALIESDNDLPDNVEIISDGTKQLGMTTTNHSKLNACRVFKEFIESNKLIVKSDSLIAEIKTYVQTKGSYAAQPGSTDDCVAATLLVCRVVHTISSYDSAAYEHMYAVEGGELSDDDGTTDYDDYDEMPIVV